MHQKVSLNLELCALHTFAAVRIVVEIKSAEMTRPLPQTAPSSQAPFPKAIGVRS